MLTSPLPHDMMSGLGRSLGALVPHRVVISLDSTHGYLALLLLDPGRKDLKGLGVEAHACETAGRKE